MLAGQNEHAGVLGELVTQADQASVAQELGGNPAKALAAPRHALQRKLLDGLRYLLKEEFKLNQPQASDGWLTQDTLWLVSKTVSDKLRAHLLAQGIEGIPANNTAVFNVLQDHGILQPTPEDKAIWKATVSSDVGWSHTFTLLRLAPSLIWESGERPPPFAGSVDVIQEPDAPAEATPTSSVAAAAAGTESSAAHIPSPATAQPATSGDGVDALLDLLGTPDIPAARVPPVEASPEPLQQNEPTVSASVVVTEAQVPAQSATPSGEHFMHWLRQRIETRKLVINDAKALVHTVADTVYLVSPGVFQRYAQEHPQTAFLARQDAVADWQWVQKRFEKLQLHRKQDSGLNIWTCEVTGPRKSRRLHGYLLKDPIVIFDDPPPNNPYLVTSESDDSNHQS